MSKNNKPTKPVVRFHEDFHWPLPQGSITFHPAELEVDQDIADAAVSGGFAELVSGAAKPFLPALADDIEDAE